MTDKEMLSGLKSYYKQLEFLARVALGQRVRERYRELQLINRNLHVIQRIHSKSSGYIAAAKKFETSGYEAVAVMREMVEKFSKQDVNESAYTEFFTGYRERLFTKSGVEFLFSNAGQSLLSEGQNKIVQMLYSYETGSHYKRCLISLVRAESKETLEATTNKIFERVKCFKIRFGS